MKAYKGSIIDNVEVIRLGAPLHSQIELTSSCQYECFFCYNIWKTKDSKIKGSSLTREQAFKVAEQLIECKIFSVVLSGGEPTLVNYLHDLIAFFHEADIEISMITNGARLDKLYLNKLEKVGLNGIQISMHHFEENIFNKIAGNPKAYELTVNGIENSLNVFGAEAININMVVTSDTVKDITEMSKFLKSLGVESMSVSLVSTSGLAAVNRLICDYEDLDNAYNQMVKISEYMDISFVGGLPFCSLPMDYNPSVVSMSNICDAAISQIVIGPNGGLRPCVEWPQEAGNIFQDDLIDIWQNSEIFEGIRNFKNTPLKCRSCEQVPYCHGGCRASALAVTKDLCGDDPMMKPWEVCKNGEICNVS